MKPKNLVYMYNSFIDCLCCSVGREDEAEELTVLEWNDAEQNNTDFDSILQQQLKAKKLMLLSEKILTDALREFVEKEEDDAFSE